VAEAAELTDRLEDKALEVLLAEVEVNLHTQQQAEAEELEDLENMHVA
jgi:hypothetical protein